MYLEPSDTWYVLEMSAREGAELSHRAARSNNEDRPSVPETIYLVITDDS